MLTALWVHPSPYLQWGLVVAFAAVAARIDIRTGRIPNPLTAAVWVAGLLAAYLTAGFAGVADALLGMVVMGTPFVLLFLVGGGAGDAKLMAALGMWLGWGNGLIALAAVALIGGIVGVCYAIVCQRTVSVAANLWQMATTFLGILVRTHKLADVPNFIPQNDDMIPMPYGVSIFLGVFAAAAGALIYRGAMV